MFLILCWKQFQNLILIKLSYWYQILSGCSVQIVLYWHDSLAKRVRNFTDFSQSWPWRTCRISKCQNVTLGDELKFPLGTLAPATKIHELELNLYSDNFDAPKVKVSSNLTCQRQKVGRLPTFNQLLAVCTNWKQHSMYVVICTLYAISYFCWRVYLEYSVCRGQFHWWCTVCDTSFISYICCDWKVILWSHTTWTFFLL